MSVEVGSRLRQVVRKAGGNAAVAALAGVSLTTLGDYIAGRHDMKLGTAQRLAEVCGVSLHWLASGVSEVPTHRPAEEPSSSLPEEQLEALRAELHTEVRDSNGRVIDRPKTVVEELPTERELLGAPDAVLAAWGLQVAAREFQGHARGYVWRALQKDGDARSDLLEMASDSELIARRLMHLAAR